MSFNLEQWKESTKQNLQGWKERMERAGINSAYYFLAGVSLLPLVQVVHSGDWSGLSVLGASLGGAISTNLLANIVQKSKDKSDAEIAELLKDEAKSKPEIRAELDTVIEKLETLPEAEKTLSEEDKAWFAEIIQKELKKLNSSVRFEAKLTGDGAIAQGDNSVAVGKGGVYVGGNVSGSNIVLGNGNIINNETK